MRRSRQAGHALRVELPNRGDESPFGSDSVGPCLPRGRSISAPASNASSTESAFRFGALETGRTTGSAVRADRDIFTNRHGHGTRYQRSDSCDQPGAYYRTVLMRSRRASRRWNDAINGTEHGRSQPPDALGVMRCGVALLGMKRLSEWYRKSGDRKAQQRPDTTAATSAKRLRLCLSQDASPHPARERRRAPPTSTR